MVVFIIITTMSFIRKVKVGEKIYLAEVESTRVNGKVKQKFIRYIGREMNGQTIRKVEINNIKIENVKRSLDVLAIDKIAEELTLKNFQNKYILALIYSQLLEKRSINKLEEWIRFTEIPEILGLKEISVKELYECLSDINDESFEKINNDMQEIFAKYPKENDAAIIDVTDTYFEGNSNNIKRRRGKDGKVRRLVQIGLATSFKNSFPILHKQYHGNLSGISILKDMVLELKSRRLSSIIIDRGMMSPENKRAISSLNLQLIAGIRKNSKFIKDFILKIDRDDIYSLKNMVKLKNTFVFIKTFQYDNGELIVVYNPSLEVIKKQLNFNKEIDSNLDLGYSLIYHNTNYSPKEVVKKYYEKEIIERAFKQIKGILNLRPIRVWLKDHVEGHIKICYLAYAILSLMNYKLKEIKVSVIDALESLKYGYKVKLKDNKTKFEWDLIVPLNPKQKEILKRLGVVTKN